MSAGELGVRIRSSEGKQGQAQPQVNHVRARQTIQVVLAVVGKRPKGYTIA